MAFAYGNRIKDVIAASGGGTGTITLSGSPAATYFALSNIGATGTTFDYVMEDGTNWEIGVGTTGATANTFTRSVTASSNSNTAVNFAAGANFFITASAATLATFITASSTTTFSNKRFTPRVNALSGAIGSPTYSSDNYDVIELTAVTGITDLSTNLTGTPVKGDTLTYHITDNGTARSIPWGTKFEDSSLSKPATTVINQKLSVWFEWNAASSKWRLAGYA